MRQTPALHHAGDEVVIIEDTSDLLHTICGGLRVRITELYWEEDAWGYSVKPLADQKVAPRQAQILAMSMLHDRDFTTGHD